GAHVRAAEVEPAADPAVAEEPRLAQARRDRPEADVAEREPAREPVLAAPLERDAALHQPAAGLRPDVADGHPAVPARRGGEVERDAQLVDRDPADRAAGDRQRARAVA